MTWYFNLLMDLLQSLQEMILVDLAPIGITDSQREKVAEGRMRANS